MTLIFPDGRHTRPLPPSDPRFNPSQYPIPPAQNVPPFIPVNMGGNTRTMAPNPEYGRLHGLEWDGSKWVKANPNSDLERKAAEMALEQARWRMQQEKEKAEREKLEWNEQYQRDFAERLRESAVPMPPEQTPEQIRAAQLRQVAIEQANFAKRQANLDRARRAAMENSGRFNPGPGPDRGAPRIGPVGPVDDAGRSLPKPGQAQPITGADAEDPRLREIFARLQAEYPDIPAHQLMEAAKQMLEEMRKEQEQDFYSKFPGMSPPLKPQRAEWIAAGKPGYDPNGTYLRPVNEWGGNLGEIHAHMEWVKKQGQKGAAGSAQPYTPKQTPPIMPAPAGQPRAFNPSGPTRQLFKPGQAQPVEPPAQGTPYGASRRAEWERLGKPGAPTGAMLTVTGRSQIDGTPFGYQAEAEAYDKWLMSQGKASAGWRYPPQPGDKPPAPPKPGMTY